MDDRTPNPDTGDGTDIVDKAQAIAASASDGVKRAAHTVSHAYDAARKPGMPLSILSNIAREAPLGSLLAAFLLGYALARRR